MEGTLIASTITKETDSDLALAIEFGGKSRPGREREATTHNTIGAKHAFVDICDMH